MTEIRRMGTVEKYVEARGFGFVAADGDRSQWFFHVSEWPEDGEYPRRGDRVTFVAGVDPRSLRPRALDVRPMP